MIKKGQKFGEWEVLDHAPDRQYKSTPQKFHFWFCRCSCGVEKEVMQRNLLNGKSLSCGHNIINGLAERNTSHGHTVGHVKSLTYSSYAAMKMRCLNPNHESYAEYGGAGITICEAWLDSFDSFLADMGERPGKKYSIDRIDQTGGYSKDNCVWATYEQQNNHLRTNVFLDHAGESLTISQWAKKLGVGKDTLRGRIRRGKTVEQALTEPFKTYRKRKRGFAIAVYEANHD